MAIRSVAAPLWVDGILMFALLYFTRERDIYAHWEIMDEDGLTTRHDFYRWEPPIEGVVPLFEEQVSAEEKMATRLRELRVAINKHLEKRSGQKSSS